MGFLRLLFVPEAVCMLKLNSNHFWHASSAHIISVAGCVFLTVNLSLIYMYLFISNQKHHVCMCSPGECSWPRSAQQSMGGFDPAACPASAQFWLLLLWLGAFLVAY